MADSIIYPAKHPGGDCGLLYPSSESRASYGIVSCQTSSAATRLGRRLSRMRQRKMHADHKPARWHTKHEQQRGHGWLRFGFARHVPCSLCQGARNRAGGGRCPCLPASSSTAPIWGRDSSTLHRVRPSTDAGASNLGTAVR